MSFLRVGVAIMMVVLGAAGVLMGAAVTVSALRTGEISYSTATAARGKSVTLSREADGTQFWKLFAMLGLAPAVLGAAAATWGWRNVRM